MRNHNFKVGDKVWLKDPKTFSLGTATLTIIRFERDYIKVTWGGVKNREFPLYPDEIKGEIKIGEQLEFNFMR